MLTSALTVLTKQCRNGAVARLAPGYAVRRTYRFRHGIAPRGSVTSPLRQELSDLEATGGRTARAAPIGAARVAFSCLWRALIRRRSARARRRAPAAPWPRAAS